MAAIKFQSFWLHSFFFLASLLTPALCVAQTIKVKHLQTLDLLADVNVMMDERAIGATTKNGEVKITGIGGRIQLSHLGFITKYLERPSKDTVVLMMPAELLLSEVVISPSNEKVLGYFGVWGNGVIQGRSSANSSIANQISIVKRSQLKSFLFYIPKHQESAIHIPFEFVIFKEVNGVYSNQPLFKPIEIAQYDYLWNSYSLASHNLSLPPGNYLFGIRWIKNKAKNSMPSFGTIVKYGNDVNIATYRLTKRSGWQVLGSGQDAAKQNLALLGLTVSEEPSYQD